MVQSFKLEPKNKRQRDLMSYIDNPKYGIIIASGFAGTGKTTIASYKAVEKLNEKQIKRIIVMRPPEPLDGQTVGFLKGDKDSKVMPWAKQIAENFVDMLGKERFTKCIESDTIVFELLETCRGRDFKDCFVIIDEAQLLTPKQIQAVTTRLSGNSKLILCGDENQCEGKRTQRVTDKTEKLNGISYLKKVIADCHINEIPIVEFLVEDCLRQPIVKKLIIAYEKVGWM